MPSSARKLQFASRRGPLSCWRVWTNCPSNPSVPAAVPFFFFNDTATTEIYTLSLHDALPISSHEVPSHPRRDRMQNRRALIRCRSEEHTSELQSRQYLVCRLLLEKKTKPTRPPPPPQNTPPTNPHPHTPPPP